MPDPGRGVTSRGPVLLVTLLLAALSTAPYLAAFADPPRGRAFLGAFWFVDDTYNYLSFVQQSEAGAWVFQNKLVWEDHAKALVNLEWLVVGWISRLVGGHPVLAYRLFGLAALVALVAGIDRWLLAAGLPRTHRLPALLLVATGGGLGGLRVALGTPVRECLDLMSGLYPALEALSNPHFIAGTALLLWALRAYAAPAGTRSFAAAAALGTVLGLTRPYDLVVLVLIRSLVVVVSEPVRAWWRHAAAMAALLPVVAYNYWAFYRQPAFAFYTTAEYVFPTRAEFAWALGPGMALATLALAARPSVFAGEGRAAALHLAVWWGIAAVVIIAHPVHFSLQFLLGAGLPVLALAALGLAQWPPRRTYMAALAFSGTTAAAVWVMLQPTLAAYVPEERLALAWALREDCRAGDRLIAPADIGLWAGGFTACRAFTSHAIEPAHDERAGAIDAFYGRGDPAGRAAFLERICATHVVLPAALPAPLWVDPRVGLQPVALAGRADRALAAYRISSRCTGAR